MIYANRIRLRGAEREDIPRFVEWLNDPEVRQYLSHSMPLSRAEEERWFDNMLSRPKAEHVLVIEVKTDEGWKPVGNMSLMDVDWLNRNAEVGIFIGEKDLWNKGYGTDAMRLMLRYAFTALNLHRIYLRVHEDNKRGIRTYEKAGYVHEGRLRQAIFRNGKYADFLVMSVLQTEWQDSEF